MPIFRTMQILCKIALKFECTYHIDLNNNHTRVLFAYLCTLAIQKAVKRKGIKSIARVHFQQAFTRLQKCAALICTRVYCRPDTRNIFGLH